jgi:hypothetical protein
MRTQRKTSTAPCEYRPAANFTARAVLVGWLHDRLTLSLHSSARHTRASLSHARSFTYYTYYRLELTPIVAVYNPKDSTEYYQICIIWNGSAGVPTTFKRAPVRIWIKPIIIFKVFSSWMKIVLKSKGMATLRQSPLRQMRLYFLLLFFCHLLWPWSLSLPYYCDKTPDNWAWHWDDGNVFWLRFLIASSGLTSPKCSVCAKLVRCRLLMTINIISGESHSG